VPGSSCGIYQTCHVIVKRGCAKLKKTAAADRSVDMLKYAAMMLCFHANIWHRQGVLIAPYSIVKVKQFCMCGKEAEHSTAFSCEAQQRAGSYSFFWLCLLVFFLHAVRLSSRCPEGRTRYGSTSLACIKIR